jgi:hypothetical protein
VDFASRRQQKLLADRGLVIMPQGPGMGRFLTSAALLLGTLVLIMLAAGPMVKSRVEKLKPDDVYHIYMVTAAAHDHWDALPDDLGVMEKFARWRPHNTNAVTEPLWPWLASRVPGVASDPEFMATTAFDPAERVERVLWAQVGLAAGFAGIIGLMAAKRWPVGVALGAVLPATGLVLLPLALEPGPGLLFAILNFITWMTALRLLQRNHMAQHVVFGIFCGLAWLTDERGWMVPAVWLVVSGLKALRSLLRSGEVLEDVWSGRRHFVGLVAAGLAWLLICAPRLSTASKRWGEPFFSASYQWMWAENGAEAFRADLAAAFFYPQKDAPERDVPSFETWRANPSATLPAERLRTGAVAAAAEFVRGNPWVWRGIYPAGLLLILAIAGGLLLVQKMRPDQSEAGLALQSRDAVGRSAFVVLAVLCALAWEAWLWPVTGSRAGLRMVWCPFVYSLAAAVAALADRAAVKGVPAVRLVPVTVLVWGLNVGLAVLPVLEWLRRFH